MMGQLPSSRHTAVVISSPDSNYSWKILQFYLIGAIAAFILSAFGFRMLCHILKLDLEPQYVYQGCIFLKIQPTTICRIQLISNRNQAQAQWRSALSTK